MGITRSNASPFLPPTLAAAGVALALLVSTAPAGAQQLSACYVPKSGTVYMIKQTGTPTACLSKQHVEFTWSSTGAQGPQGPAGPAGPEGPQGPQGLSGPLSGLEFHSASETLIPSGSANFGIFFATCSVPTKSVITFGHVPSSISPGTVFSSRPAINGSQVTWAFSGSANSSWAFYWACADGVITPP